MEARHGDIEERAGGYRFFSHVLLALPDEQLVTGVLQSPLLKGYEGESSPGVGFLRRFARACEGEALEKTVAEVSVDRTRLLRGLTEGGPLPPYESLFVGGERRFEVTAAVAGVYRQAGYVVGEEVHDSPEHLGVELGFMEALLREEAASVERGDADEVACARARAGSFFRDHVGCWGGRFADEMFAQAQTDFYRGMARLLKQFLEEERACFES